MIVFKTLIFRGAPFTGQLVTLELVFAFGLNWQWNATWNGGMPFFAKMFFFWHLEM